MNKTLSKEMVEMLKKPLPSEAIKPHPTKSYLSSIKAIYVVERLNEVFGIGSWQLNSEVVNDKSDMIVVKSVLTIPEYGIILESFGGNDNGGVNSKNFDLGDAYKGATTDALTKICSYLEIGIDVFKGIGYKEQNENQTVSKPWLNFNTPEYHKAFEFVSRATDKQAAIKVIKDTYSVSKKVEEALLK